MRHTLPGQSNLSRHNETLGVVSPCADTLCASHSSRGRHPRRRRHRRRRRRRRRRHRRHHHHHHHHHPLQAVFQKSKVQRSQHFLSTFDNLRDAVVSRRDFAESYAKPFKACAKAKAMGVMCAYNQVQRKRGFSAELAQSLMTL